MKYEKLIRDKIPEIIRSKGGKPVVRLAGNDEYHNHLRLKLQEEVTEFLRDDNPEELADIMEVILAICDEKGFSRAELELVRQQKATEKGRFTDKIILEEA